MKELVLVLGVGGLFLPFFLDIELDARRVGREERYRRCAAAEFRCELRCNEVTKGGSLEQIRCHEECRRKEDLCLKEKEVW